jgi:chemotaxis protein MotA
MAGPVKKNKTKPDFGTIGGVLLAAAGIVGGLILEGGELRDITQVTAALIVLGGTFGAVLINTPLPIVVGAVKRTHALFFEAAQPYREVLEQMIEYATKARKAGLMALEQEADNQQDPFLRKALGLAADGTDLQELRKMLEIEIEQRQHHIEAEAKVFESAGGYAPTIGIIGAVLGLIQVMKNLSNIDMVGHGIAVSFVATVYGVAVANIFLLPAANKIKARGQAEAQLQELILEGILGIAEGLNPKIIRSKLEGFIPDYEAAQKKAKKDSGPAAPVAAKAV